MYYSLRIVLLTASLAALVFSVDVDPSNDIEKKLLQFFGRWRNGDSAPFSLPPLDLIQIPATNGSYSGRGIRITYSTSSVNLLGVNNFSVESLNVSLPLLYASGSLRIPSIVLQADQYTIQGRAFYVYSLKGAGKLNATMHDVNLLFGIRLTDLNNTMKVSDMSLDFTIASIKANLENSSWPINRLLNQEGVQILNRYHDDIITAVKATLVYHLDRYLMKITPSELFDRIRSLK